MNEREIYLSFGDLCDKLLADDTLHQDIFQSLVDVSRAIGMRSDLLESLTTAHESSFDSANYYRYTNPSYRLFKDIAEDIQKNPWKYPETRTS